MTLVEFADRVRAIDGVRDVVIGDAITYRPVRIVVDALKEDMERRIYDAEAEYLSGVLPDNVEFQLVLSSGRSSLDVLREKVDQYAAVVKD